MRTVFFIPPLRTLSGGLATIYQTALALHELGKKVALMGPDEEAAGLAEARRNGLAVLPWESELRGNDGWCIPESWPGALAPGARAGARVFVYAQSWIYLFNPLPGWLRWNRLPARFIAASRPIARILQEIFNVEVAHILPPALDPVFFHEGERPATHVRVAWMPRKNRALGEQVQRIATACLERIPAPPRVVWTPLHKLSREEVAKTLRACHLFLCTAFPEGFGLPPLEAMASGCVPLGFTGYGGWEYMRQAAVRDLGSPYAPPFDLPRKAAPDSPEQGGNGFFFADGDTLGAGEALAKAVVLAHENGPAWRTLAQSCRATAQHYTAARRQEALLAAFTL